MMIAKRVSIIESQLMVHLNIFRSHFKVYGASISLIIVSITTASARYPQWILSKARVYVIDNFFEDLKVSKSK